VGEEYESWLSTEVTTDILKAYQSAALDNSAQTALEYLTHHFGRRKTRAKSGEMSETKARKILRDALGIKDGRITQFINTLQTATVDRHFEVRGGTNPQTGQLQDYSHRKGYSHHT
jgi:hypothetical protein